MPALASGRHLGINSMPGTELGSWGRRRRRHSSLSWTTVSTAEKGLRLHSEPPPLPLPLLLLMRKLRLRKYNDVHTVTLEHPIMALGLRPKCFPCSYAASTNLHLLGLLLSEPKLGCYPIYLREQAQGRERLSLKKGYG